MTTPPPLTGRLGATVATFVATGQTMTAASPAKSGLLRPMVDTTTMPTVLIAGASAVRPHVTRVSPSPPVVFLNQGLALTLYHPAAAGAQGHTLRTIRYQMM